MEVPAAAAPLDSAYEFDAPQFYDFAQLKSSPGRTSSWFNRPHYEGEAGAGRGRVGAVRATLQSEGPQAPRPGLAQARDTRPMLSGCLPLEPCPWTQMRAAPPFGTGPRRRTRQLPTPRKQSRCVRVHRWHGSSHARVARPRHHAPVHTSGHADHGSCSPGLPYAVAAARCGAGQAAQPEGDVVGRGRGRCRRRQAWAPPPQGRRPQSWYEPCAPLPAPVPWCSFPQPPLTACNTPHNPCRAALARPLPITSRCWPPSVQACGSDGSHAGRGRKQQAGRPLGTKATRCQAATGPRQGCCALGQRQARARRVSDGQREVNGQAGGVGGAPRHPQHQQAHGDGRHGQAGCQQGAWRVSGLRRTRELGLRGVGAVWRGRAVAWAGRTVAETCREMHSSRCTMQRDSLIG